MVTVLLGVLFAGLVGRNDGSPLIALAIRSLHERAWWPPLLLVTAVILVPVLGVHAVAQTLAELFASTATGQEYGLALLLLATIGTLLLSSLTGIPTSIILALVGASAGAQLAQGSLETRPIIRVLILAAAGPVVAWLLALAVTRLLTLARGSHLERTVRWQQVTGFIATAVAYGANDGQKLLAVFSVMAGVTVTAGAVDLRVLTLVIICFLAGSLWGLRRSAHSLRQGVLHPKPYQVASTLWSSATAVLLGSAAATPVSMSQSLTGALIGSAPPREWRRLRWEQTRKVLLAWIWTLPIAGSLAWALTISLITLSAD